MIIKCDSWSASDEFFRGRCSVGKFRGRPSFGECIDLCGAAENTHKELDEHAFKLARAEKSASTVKKGHNVSDLLSRFAEAMTKWGKSGFPVCEKGEYLWRKQQCLLHCGDYWQCPECGCCKSVKAWLSTEKCPRAHWAKYPGDGLVSVLIAAANEPHLNKTIESLYANAQGPIEIIVVLDGFDAVEPVDPRARVLRQKAQLGKKVCSNIAARTACGEYLFIVDAHCTLSEGWDRMLKFACRERTVVATANSSL